MGILKGRKTYVVAGVTVIGAVASWLVGDTTLIQSAQLIVPAILSATVRHAVAKK